MRLSVIVITRNESAVIARCLDSVAWAQQRIVLDHGSSDGTPQIAREAGAQVHVTPDWPGFGPQKNRALALAEGDWVLALDADEWLSPALAQEIRETLRNPAPAAAYSLPRRSSYCGRSMRHSGWWPDELARLFRRGHGRFSDDLIHERLLVDGPLGRLRGELMHEAFTDLEEVLHKVNSYSTWSAQALQQRGVRAGLGKAVSRGLWSFLRTYLLRAGFLDGREGFMLAVSNAEGTYYKYLKLMLRERQRKS